jgi:hypothetical protein
LVSKCESQWKKRENIEKKKKAIKALLPRLHQQTSGHLEELGVPLPTTVAASVWSPEKATHAATTWWASSTC